MPPENPKNGDRRILLLVASLLGNVLLLTQLFVMRPEYVAELRGIRERLSNIESHLGISTTREANPRAERGAGP